LLVHVDLPGVATVVSANINAVQMLGVGDFVIVSTPSDVRLAQGELSPRVDYCLTDDYDTVITMYSKRVLVKTGTMAPSLASIP
jgi:hypothetical protein